MMIAAIIPARYESTRFRGKPLAKICNKPMLQWVYEAAHRCALIDQVIIATDHEKIRQAAESFGAHVCMTSSSHTTGTDRIAEVAQHLDARIIVNLQGDEPLLVPEVIREALMPMMEDETLLLSTLKTVIDNENDIPNSNVVKVVTDINDWALYFSRSPIPFRSDTARSFPFFRHIGLYVFRKDFLLTFTRLPRTMLEKAESLEQLRALEHGYRIKVPTSHYKPIGVDSPEDVARVEKMLISRNAARKT